MNWRGVAQRWGAAALIWGAASAGDAETNDLVKQFYAANQLVAQGSYAEGAAAYSQLPTGLRTSAALEYNRAVAYLRAGEAGRAQAHLLRAERLAPRDPRVQAALAQVASRLPAPGPDPLASPWQWTDRLTLNEWGTLAFLSVWAWGALLLAGRWRPAWRPTLRGYCFAIGGLAVIVSGLTISAVLRRARLPNAIVLKPETVVRVSPLDEARPAFSLAEGARVRSSDAPPGWLLVEEPSTRRFGWVKSDSVAQLPLL